MRAKLVRIGNSRGIRLPKPLIEQAGLSDEVELEARKGAIVISPVNGTRAGWEDAALVLHERATTSWLTGTAAPGSTRRSGSGSRRVGQARGSPPGRSTANTRPRDQKDSAMRSCITG